MHRGGSDGDGPPSPSYGDSRRQSTGHVSTVAAADSAIALSKNYASHVVQLARRHWSLRGGLLSRVAGSMVISICFALTTTVLDCRRAHGESRRSATDQRPRVPLPIPVAGSELCCTSMLNWVWQLEHQRGRPCSFLGGRRCTSLIARLASRYHVPLQVFTPARKHW